MKILLVAIPNHHFFQWANQLKDSGHEVFWFDVQDDRVLSDRISWVNQHKNWKIKYDFPFRIFIKSKLPKIYNLIQKYNVSKLENEFQNYLNAIQPNVVHCFEMRLTGLPILSVMQKNKIPFMYSSWGSDIFRFENYGIQKKQVVSFLSTINFVITDCIRDKNIITEFNFLPEKITIFPGNGGILINSKDILTTEERKLICFKGYQMDVGEAIQIVKALEYIPISELINFNFLVYSADLEIEKYIEESIILQQLSWEIFNRSTVIPNQKILEIFGKTAIHISNNVSDGMPNSLLEAMGMGAFPIQSNPGKATEEVIQNGLNGYLIQDPLDFKQIAVLLQNAIINFDVRRKAQEYNVQFIRNHFDREILKTKIIAVYNEFLNPKA
jgi:glycosyltransferase involved in cell wall biosynthesis